MTRCGRHRSAVDEPINVEGRTFKVLTVDSHELTVDGQKLTVKNHAVAGRDLRRARPRSTVVARHTSWTLVGGGRWPRPVDAGATAR